ncbi:hypothetical protein BRC83_06190 [Halobacteriales archaeon QS_1_68_17]|nr:MAG: hypothetical protein BRC83_06190 [Halobacteriales archaeon QS_1_68_17]
MGDAVVVGAAALVAGAGVTPAAAPGVGGPSPADTTIIRITVRPDGTAVCTVQYRVELDGDDASSRFASVSRRIDARPLEYTGPFAGTMQRAASLAADDTDRAMEIRNVTVRARELPTRRGAVTYRFEWTNFAATADGEVVIGDALVGFSLPSNRTTLVIQWPRGDDPERIVPAPGDAFRRAVSNGNVSIAGRGPTSSAVWAVLNAVRGLVGSF